MHSWQNPEKLWATQYTDFEMNAEESFIMFGYGSPVNEFCNKSKQPYELTSEELKVEIVTRAQTDSSVHPNLVTLTQRCVIDTAYMHIVRNSQPVKPWNSECVTLIGDAVFK